MAESPYKDRLTTEHLGRYIAELSASGRSANTIGKYTRELSRFLEFTDSQERIGSDILEQFRASFSRTEYTDQSIDSYVSRAYAFCHWLQMDVTKTTKISHKSSVREITNSDGLTNDDYKKLIQTGIACGMEQTVMMLQVLVGTQMRYSNMASLTVEVLEDDGVVEYKSHGENSTVKREHIPEQLSKALLEYAARNDITSGRIFRTSRGTFPNRSNTWHYMKKLCDLAGVEQEMVSPQKIKKALIQDIYSPSGRKL